MDGNIFFDSCSGFKLTITFDTQRFSSRVLFIIGVYFNGILSLKIHD